MMFLRMFLRMNAKTGPDFMARVATLRFAKSPKENKSGLVFGDGGFTIGVRVAPPLFNFSKISWTY